MDAVAIASLVTSPRLLVRRLNHLCSHGATPLTPLYHVYTTPGEANISSALVTAAIRIAAASTPYGFSPSDVNARALHTGGAMTLLCARVDTNIIKMVGRCRSRALYTGGAMALLCARVVTNIIKMVGRWRSEAMFRYTTSKRSPLNALPCYVNTPRGLLHFAPC
jgi:hypothetical protein